MVEQSSDTGRSPDGFERKAEGFEEPTQLPRNEEEAKRWQDANQAWWERSPMRYDWRDAIAGEEGSADYYAEIDRRFFASARQYLPWRSKPFDQLLPFEELRTLDVLEIGVGFGTHAQLIAPCTRSFVGIDLTQRAVEMTRRRFDVFRLPGRIERMDAERMQFADESFDLIWSWGVIHHSANTRAILEEMSRVLRPGGRAIVMVYHRSAWKYLIVDGFLKGVLGGGLRRKGSVHKVSQSQTDGAIARYYTVSEWTALCNPMFSVHRIRIVGQKNDVVPLPGGRVKDWVERVIPDPVSRALTNGLRMGSFLVSELKKRT